ncbi:mercuric transporter MerT family protein [Ramlibacter sp. PS4R-6]|uniref:mercuric transporter MerT family protein n=1 Tax=Ramlibacter sp. PS4R-6 TaxID=3133438 RepID=UPI003097D938
MASPLTLAGIAALLASTCCVLPLIFAVVGVSGAWIGQLRRMEPYSYPLTALAAASLLVAGWRIWRSATPDAAQCEAEACVRSNAAARRWFWALAALTVLPIALNQSAHLFY